MSRRSLEFALGGGWRRWNHHSKLYIHVECPVAYGRYQYNDSPSYVWIVPPGYRESARGTCVSFQPTRVEGIQAFAEWLCLQPELDSVPKVIDLAGEQVHYDWSCWLQRMYTQWEKTDGA